MWKEWILESQIGTKERKDIFPRGRGRVCQISRSGCSHEFQAVMDSRYTLFLFICIYV